jgi:hypothetical protein
MTTAEQKTQTELLNILQEQIEELISNYALDQIEDLNDEEYDQISKQLNYSGLLNQVGRECLPMIKAGKTARVIQLRQ